MQRHKIHDSDHEYCQFCDLDFESFEEHLDHQIEVGDSNPDDLNHIVCRFCSVEFKNTGTRDDHVKQAIKPNS